MNNIKDNENLNQKKILLRLDLNVPLKNELLLMKQELIRYYQLLIF